MTTVLFLLKSVTIGVGGVKSDQKFRDAIIRKHLRFVQNAIGSRKDHMMEERPSKITLGKNAFLVLIYNTLPRTPCSVLTTNLLSSLIHNKLKRCQQYFVCCGFSYVLKVIYDTQESKIQLVAIL